MENGFKTDKYNVFIRIGIKNVWGEDKPELEVMLVTMCTNLINDYLSKQSNNYTVSLVIDVTDENGIVASGLEEALTKMCSSLITEFLNKK